MSVLKRTPEDLKHDVITMNEEYLCENTVDQIIHFMPSIEEQKRLNELAVNIPLDDFNQAEKVVIMVC